MPRRRHVGLAAAVVSSTVLGTALPAFVAQADPTTLYVNNAASANCSDGGTGTHAQPFCTVQAAANVAQAGQTVQIAPGSYPEQVTVTHSGAQGSPIVFKGGANYQQALSTVGVPSGSASAQTAPHAFVLSGVHDVTVTGLRLQAPQDGVLVSDSDRITVDGNDIEGVGIGSQGPAAAVRLTGRTTASTVSRNFITASHGGVAVDAGVTGAVITTNLMALAAAGVTVSDAPGTVVTSNSISANCFSSVVLAGNSANSTIENNILSSLNVACAGVTDLAVSAASVSGTKVDYNLVSQQAGSVNYAWGDATYTSPAAFTAATGQGGHDIAGAWPYGTRGTAAIDSADANAPGELATDVYGNPRMDDTDVANTGTGVGYYDRGATELQDPMSPRVFGSPSGAVWHPLDADIQVWAGNTWGPVTGTVEFGDGSAKQAVTGPVQLTHTYPGPGSYTLSLTITDGQVTRTATGTVVIPVVGDIDPQFGSWQDDWSVPRETFNEFAGSPWPITKFVLDFGDGSPKAENAGPYSPNPFTHTFPGPGTYTVTETVTDDHGRTASKSRDVQVGTLLPLNRTIEAVQWGRVTEIYNDGGGWHDDSLAIPNLIPASTLDFTYNASGQRVIEAVEGGVLHEIYSAADGWHDGQISGAGANTTALSFTYSPSGARVIEAIEGGVLHEIYSAADGWHDNPIAGVAPNVSALSFTYNASGQRVIEAIEGGVLHEVYSAADGWHDIAVPGAGSNIKSLSLKLRPTGDRVIEAVEGNMLHEIYTNNGAWFDSATPINQGDPSTIALALR